MAKSFELIVENVRCFAGSHRLNIRPLTIFLGENSSGKSTLLALLSAVCAGVKFPFNPGFNDPPFSLGSYETIATFKGGKYGRAKHFSIGFKTTDAKSNSERESIATYCSFAGQPALSNFSVRHDKAIFSLSLSKNEQGESNYQVEFETPKVKKISFQSAPLKGQTTSYNMLQIIISAAQNSLPRDEAPAILNELFTVLETPYGFSDSPYVPLSVAPIRTKPKRTYDEATEVFQPEGDHIPFVLARILGEQSSDQQKAVLLDALTAFGKQSGLFQSIVIKRLGKQVQDPFQINVKIAGPAANVLDVGYGVSQSLPVIVQSVLKARNELLLLQQPEVHLHPKAQAALGSFLARLVTSHEKTFVLETHSDFIVDRIRMEIAAGTISASDVNLVYLDRDGIETTIHQMEIDDKGNITNAPSTYRSFFLKEEIDLLSRASGDSK